MVVDHLEGDARLDESLVEAERRVLDPLADPVAAVEPRGLLRVDEPHPGERPLVAQVALGPVAPRVDLLDRLQPAGVVEGAGELREPGPHAVGQEVGDPEADLVPVLHRVLPSIGLFDSDAEEARDGLAAQRGTVLLGVHPDGPGGHEAAARLAIGRHHRREVADPLHVQAARGSAARVGNDAGVGVDLAHLRVPEAPQLEEPVLLPPRMRPSRRVLRIRAAREVEAGGRAEGRLAVRAVAHAGAGPAIAEDRVHLVPRDDLARDLSHEVEIIRAERAGDP
jgi:hypothetical protein